MSIHTFTFLSPVYDISNIGCVALDLAENIIKNQQFCTIEQLVLEILYIGDMEVKVGIIMHNSYIEHFVIRPKLVNLHQQNVNQSGSHAQTSQTLR